VSDEKDEKQQVFGSESVEDIDKLVMETIVEASKTSGTIMKYGTIVDALVLKGLTREVAESHIKAAKARGDIYEPMMGAIKLAEFKTADSHTTIAKEITRKKHDAPSNNPARALVDDVAKEKLKTMIDEAKQETQATQAQENVYEEGGITLATAQESKVLVEDLSKRYDIPPGFVLVFKDRKSGALSTYFTKNFYGVLIERKGYSYPITYTPGPKHKPEEHRYHYIASLIPVITRRAIDALALLKDKITPSEFLAEYRRLTQPISEEGYASPDTVRMRTMKTDYNLERLARTRAYRHLAALYCGVSSPMEREREEQAEEVESEGAIVDTTAQDVSKGGEK